MACSTWLTYLLRTFGSEKLRGQFINGSAHPYLVRGELKGDPAKIEAQFASQEYFSFLVVRNPFDRLLSAYRDRILNPFTAEAKDAIPKIIKREKLDTNLTAYLKRHGKKNLAQFNGTEADYPTFSMFLRYVVRQRNRYQKNLHWMGYHDRCLPCRFNYTAIVKLETAKTDHKYVLRQSGLLKFGADFEHAHQTKGGKTESVRRKYFSQIDCSLLRLVYDMYRVDFQLFGYQPKAHFDICRQN